MLAPRASFAPVAIFAYRRVEPLIEVLDALERCPEFAASPVYVFSDGAKTDAARDDVAAVRAMAKARLRPNMHLVEASENKGLARSIIGGVERLCSEYGRVIVIEDDLLVSPVTLTWFNRALSAYEDDETVWQISAHQHDVPELTSRDQALFLHFSTSWGWATWKRAWDNFDPEATGWESLSTDRALRREFDIEDGYPFADMLEQQMAGRVDSWAIRFRWSIFKARGLTLFPPVSLVTNFGIDGKATHVRFGWLRRFLRKRPVHRDTYIVPAFPDAVAEEPAARSALSKALRRKGWRARIVERAKKITVGVN